MIDETMVKNKKIGSKPEIKKHKQIYSFPDYSVSVEAESIEEANEKLQEIINNK